MKLTISLDDKEVSILKKRAKKNLLTLREQVEDIVRRSCISSSGGTYQPTCDDRLIEIFSRVKRAKKKS